MHSTFRRLTFATAILGALPSAAAAQIRASEIGTMSQIIDGTKITVEYSRPRARGRDPLFGGRVVRWNEVWTPGANWATTFETTKNITLNGTTVLVSFDVDVEPSLRMTMSASEAAPYLGTYTYIERSGPDSGKTKTLTLTYEDSTLKGRWTPDDPYFRKFALIRIAPSWFAPGVYDDKGQIYEVYKPEMTFEFKLVSGKAGSLEVRTEEDEVEAVGNRKP
jgi:hypothetical protein